MIIFVCCKSANDGFFCISNEIFEETMGKQFGCFKFLMTTVCFYYEFLTALLELE